MRAYVERCNDPPVHTLITLGSQHQGIMDLPGCDPQENPDCSWWKHLVAKGVYTPLIHNRIVQAQYFKDPRRIDQYERVNHFLRDINNEGDVKNPVYAERMASLNRMVMFMFSDDQTVVPRESSWFGWWNGQRMEHLREQPIYREDWIGLRRLDERGRLFFEEIPGEHLRINLGWVREELVKWLLP